MTTQSSFDSGSACESSVNFENQPIVTLLNIRPHDLSKASSYPDLLARELTEEPVCYLDEEAAVIMHACPWEGDEMRRAWFPQRITDSSKAFPKVPEGSFNLLSPQSQLASLFP